MIKLKRDLKSRGYVYFEPVVPTVIYKSLNYLKNAPQGDIPTSEGISSKETINFSGIDKYENVAESIPPPKLFQMKQNIVQLRIH